MAQTEPSVALESMGSVADPHVLSARDKLTRIQHLAAISRDRGPGSQTFEVAACIGGRAFGLRREDMKKLLLAASGKVFTLGTMDRLVNSTCLRGFRSR